MSPNRLAWLAPALVCCHLSAAEWQHPLWLGRGDVWRARFPVAVSNPSGAALEGVPVALPVGNEPGEAPLEGVRAEALRVTDANGTQLLFGLWGPSQSTAFTTGAIPAGATLVLPAVCGPGTSTTYTVYFDNPHAWGLADSFEKRAFTDLNGDFEKGAKEQPSGWQSGQTTPKHRLSWSADKPCSGARCLKAEADADAEKTWFGFVRSDFTVVPGARCTIRVRIRGENVKGNAGWYVHVGDEKNSQRINQTARCGEGTFDWKEQVITFTVPEGATRMQTGSVLYGTGTAWYDAFSFETDKEPPRASARAGAIERLTLQEKGAEASWLMAGRKAPRWLYRLPVRLVNLRSEPSADLLAVVDLNSSARGIAVPHLLLTLGGAPVETCRLGDRLLFACAPAARTALTYYLYVADTGAKTAPAKMNTSALGSDIPSDQILADRLGETDAAAFAKLLNSPVNLIKNPDFEAGTDTPEGWTHSTPEPNVTFSLGTPGGFGKRYARFSVPPAAKETWRGWYQSAPVKPGHSYLFGAWLACEALEGTANLNAHLRNAKGGVASGGFLGAGSPISGNAPWTPMFGTVTVPQDAAQFQMHLTMNDRGTLKHDGAFLSECLEASTGDPETPALAGKDVEVWPVDPVIKVFHETLPPQTAAPLAVSLARNEEEALQIALRAGRDIADLRVEVEAPRHKKGYSLTTFSIGWVGFVPIDHRTAYYNLKTPAWELKFPASTGACDGWSGWWPDPIRPTASGSLAANQTQPVWLSFRTAADTPAGLYKGKIRLRAGEKVLATLPFTVTVWDFALPQTPSCAAIYDLRLNEQWLADGTPAAEQRDRLMRFMASKKVCPDGIDVNLRFARGKDGSVSCDFSEYDKAAQRYFGELKFPTSYMPNFFYLFGWEHPPKNVLDEKPFEGDYPYASADRTHLRPAYKDAYQACLRLYWEHVKAKGWADKLVLYISDEPFLTKKHIIDQMKALCALIHEVDPKIRIYSSTWRHCPDWNGSLDIWGVGHYGCFPVSEMQARKAAGEHIWFTTDGQMCTDTPFCAVERLLPHYCFKYGADAYEFWGVSWLTYDPWRFGWHRYIHQTSTPGEYYDVRYPNGDGYLLYPGGPIGAAGPVTTVRLEAARDGVEDFDYLKLLKAFADATGDAEAARLLADFSALLDIPNAGGRYSSKILPDPQRLAALRLQAGAALERLSRRAANK
jgi:hypothetical protein